MKSWIAQCLLAGLGLGVLAVAPTFAGPVGTEFFVNNYTKDQQLVPSVAGLNDGGFVVVWISLQRDGASWDIHGRRFDSAGTPITNDFRINRYWTGSQINPSVAALSDGGFVVAWISTGQDGDGAGIYFRRYDAAGNSRVTERRSVNTYTAGDQREARVAGLTGGGFVVAWSSEDQNGLFRGLFVRRYDAGGRPIGGEKRVLNFADEQQIFSYLALGALDDGGFIVTWTARAGNHTDVFARQFDSAGQRVGREFRVNTQRLRAQSNSSVTGLNDGGFVVAWNSAGQDDPRFSELANHGIFAQRYDNTGQPVGTEFQVNTYTPDYQTRPKVARLADGGFVVTWQSLYQDTSPNAVSGYGIYGQRYNGAGNPVGSEFRVNTWTTYDQQNCSIAGLNDGGFVVTWQSRSRPDVHEDFSDNISGQLFGP